MPSKKDKMPVPYEELVLWLERKYQVSAADLKKEDVDRHYLLGQLSVVQLLRDAYDKRDQG